MQSYAVTIRGDARATAKQAPRGRFNLQVAASAESAADALEQVLRLWSLDRADLIRIHVQEGDPTGAQQG